LKNYVDEERIEKLSKNDFNIPAYQGVIKLQEETGELAQAFLKYDKSRNVSKSADSENPVLDVLEESCDVINVAMDLINKLIHENPDKNLEQYVKETFQNKLNKWESKQF
jgi:NTP pyrophosphatase (non-canonical NTP hydrolase)